MGSSGASAQSTKNLPPNVKSDHQLIEDFHVFIKTTPKHKIEYPGLRRMLEKELKDRGLLSRVSPFADMEHMILVHYYGWLIHRSLGIALQKWKAKNTLGMETWDASLEYRAIENERSAAEKELRGRMYDARLRPILNELIAILPK